MCFFTYCDADASVQVVAEVPPVTAHSTASLLSSLEFDCQARLLATAGVSKRIAIYKCVLLVLDLSWLDLSHVTACMVRADPACSHGAVRCSMGLSLHQPCPSLSMPASCTMRLQPMLRLHMLAQLYQRCHESPEQPGSMGRG